MALVDIDKLGAPRVNLLETLRSYERGMIRGRDRVSEAMEQLEQQKKEVKGFFINSIFKKLGWEDGIIIEVGFTTPEVGEHPELKIVLDVDTTDRKMTDLLDKFDEFNLTVKCLKSKKSRARWRIVLHEYLDRSEARMGGSIRPT